MAEVCKLLGIEKSHTTPYHPQLVERYNHTLISMLGTAASDHPFHWEDHLRPLCMAYNTSINPTTGYGPFYLIYRHSSLSTEDVAYGPPTTDGTSPTDHVANLCKQFETAYGRVRETMGVPI